MLKRINVSIWATAALPLPKTNINLNLLSVECCWVGEGLVHSHLYTDIYPSIKFEWVSILSDCKLVWTDVSFSRYIASDSPSTKEM